MLSRVEGESVLKSHTEGSYLVRATADQGRTEYSLAIKYVHLYCNILLYTIVYTIVKIIHLSWYIIVQIYIQYNTILFSVALNF